MARKEELPPSLTVRAFHEALLESGVQPGRVFKGEEWDDALMVALEMMHPQTLRQYTRLGRAHKLWTVDVGGGRGNKTKVTILAPPAPAPEPALAAAPVPVAA